MFSVVWSGQGSDGNALSNALINHVMMVVSLFAHVPEHYQIKSDQTTPTQSQLK